MPVSQCTASSGTVSASAGLPALAVPESGVGEPSVVIRVKLPRASRQLRPPSRQLDAPNRQLNAVIACLSSVVGLGAWWCTLHSGIHATVAGVVLALLTPAAPEIGQRLEHILAPWSAGFVVPVFALMSAGVSLGGNSTFDIRLFWGVFVGLVIGKPVGIILGALTASRITGIPWDGDGGARLRDLLGLALIGGIGFTVALLVSDLAFTDDRISEAKAAVLIASTAAALLGALILVLSSRPATHAADQERAAR